MTYIPPNPNGQATMANSTPVAIASDQTLPLPSGASTSANQTTANSSLSTIATNTGSATPAGTNVIGKVGIDQTTPGTTNAVSANQGTAGAIGAGWPVIGGELADTTGTFTNATQTTSVTSSSFDGYSTVIVSVNGTYGTATGVFEISDDGGTTWYSVNAARTDGSAIETGYTSLTNTNRMWTLSVSGADEFRVRSTAVASGTVNVRLSIESMPTPEAASVTAYQATASNLNATVVGTGTFAAQATLQTQTDTVMVGGVNIKEINAVAPLMGNGASGTGALRVSLANDSTGIVSLTTSTASIGKLAANSGVTIGDVNVVSEIPGTGATNLGKAEDAAHTSGDTGIMALGVRNDTLADTTNANADYAQISTDSKGRLMTAGAPRSLKGMVQVQLSNTTTETTIIAATASTFHDVYGIILANTGASTTKVSIRDDTAGTVRAIIEVPTLETRGFMLPVDSAVPQTAVNKNWTVQCGTATTALEVTAFYTSMV